MSNMQNMDSFEAIYFCFCFSFIPFPFMYINYTERTETVEGEEEPKKTELKHDKYFGEEVLGPGENTYAATVTSLSNTTCWKIDKMTVKRTLGKLRMKRRASGTMGTVA